jgi:hypothetical protein
VIAAVSVRGRDASAEWLLPWSSMTGSGDLGRQVRVGHGPSLRGDERRLDDRHRPFMPEWQLRAVEPPLGRFASTPAVDPLLSVAL